MEAYIQYEYIYKHRSIEYVSARIYPEKHLDLCVQHAKEANGKVRCRQTGKIIYNFCKKKSSS